MLFVTLKDLLVQNVAEVVTTRCLATMHNDAGQFIFGSDSALFVRMLIDLDNFVLDFRKSRH